MFDGPSKLGQVLGVPIVDGLADQGIIPILYILAERVLSPCLIDWPRTVKEVLTPSDIDKLM